MNRRCRICRDTYDPADCDLAGDQTCCDNCRAVLAGIARRGRERQRFRPEGQEERIELYRARVARGEPIFDTETA